MTFEHLDIIIPQYNETEEMIKPLLTSIENQVGVSKTIFNVTIVNDHSEWKLSDSFLKSFSYPITYLETPENGGGGMARQWGVDHTSNPLIMFCDADDRFFDCTALLNLYNSMRINNAKGRQFNLLSSSFYEEMIQAGGHGYDLIKHDKPTMIWMHGKIFRRSFLEQYNIRFYPGLRTFEDTFFGKCVAFLAPQENQLHCNYFTYLWCRNPKSITSNWNHDEKDYLYWKTDDYLTCNSNLLKFISEKQPTNTKLKELVWVDLFFTFFLLQLKEFCDTDAETLRKRKQLYDFIIWVIENYSSYIKLASNEVRLSYYTKLRNDMPRYGLYFETQSWNDFVHDLEDNEGKVLNWLLLFN